MLVPELTDQLYYASDFTNRDYNIFIASVRGFIKYMLFILQNLGEKFFEFCYFILKYYLFFRKNLTIRCKVFLVLHTKNI